MFFLSVISCVYAQAGTMSPDENKQDDPHVNQKDDNGDKQGKWIFYGKDKPEKGYPMEGKISEGSFKNDRKNGEWIMYYNDGVTPKLEGVFVNNRPNGKFIRFHPNGEIKAIGTFKKRIYSDSLKRFNEKGVLIYEGNYDAAGSESGTVKHFHDNGQPKFVYTAVNGTPTGKATRYWPNGDVKEEIIYAPDGSVKETSKEKVRVHPKADVKSPKNENAKKAPKPKNAEGFKPNAYNKVYNDNKELWQEGEFKDGILQDGRLYIYDEDGLLLKVEVYKESKYHSDGQL